MINKLNTIILKGCSCVYHDIHITFIIAMTLYLSILMEKVKLGK